MPPLSKTNYFFLAAFFFAGAFLAGTILLSASEIAPVSGNTPNALSLGLSALNATGATAATSAAKVNQTKARTGTTVPKFTPGGDAKRGGTGSAPTPNGQGTTVKSVASAEIAKNMGINPKTLLPLNVNSNSKPVQDQTKLNKQGVSNDDAGNINPRQRR